MRKRRETENACGAAENADNADVRKRDTEKFGIK